MRIGSIESSNVYILFIQYILYICYILFKRG